MFEWEEDNFSFEDSDRFEEVSKDYQNIVHGMYFVSKIVQVVEKNL